MTDHDTTDANEKHRPDPETPDEPDRSTTGSLADGDVRKALLWGTLGVLGLLAAFALLQFYTYTSSAINRWTADQYRSILQALFNLVVLLAAGAGIAVVVDRLGE